MMKKKAKKSVAGKKSAKKKGTTKKKGDELNPQGVREQIRRIIEAHAEKMTEAVAGEGEKGQVAPVKYLFEVANIHPAKEDGSEATEREESLAETLLDRLGIPKDPVVADQYEKEAMVTIPANVVREAEEDLEKEEEVLTCVGAEKS